jgi:Zn-dependent protease
VFFEPPPTRWDLNFTLFNTRVRVHPFFWLAGCILGFPLLRAPWGLLLLILWVGCVFLSILVHEFGHVLMGRFFGSNGYIVMYGFGGLAVGSSNLSNRWKRIAVFLAGPGAQFGLLAVVVAVSVLLLVGGRGPLTLSLIPTQQLTEGENKPLQRPDDQPSPQPTLHTGHSDQSHGSPVMGIVWEVLGMLVEINLIWPILNLVPLWPLDGGRVCRELCEWRMPGSRGIRVSLYISIGTAIAGVVFVVWLGQYFTAIFFGIFGYLAYMELRQLSGGGPGWGQPQQRQPWQSDPDWWKKGHRNPWQP